MVFRKGICLLFSIGLLFAFAACSGKKDQSNAGPASDQNAPDAVAVPAADPNAPDTAAKATDTSDKKDAAAPHVIGQLEQLNLKDGASPIIRGVGLDGNRAGMSAEDTGHRVNGRAISKDGIRSVFEMNEWISVRLDTDAKSGLSAVIVPHQKDLAAFTDSFVNGVSENAPRFDLKVPENPDDPNPSWGETYLHPDHWQPGDYDFVFLSENKPIARVGLKFYSEGELSNQSDEALEKLMK